MYIKKSVIAELYTRKNYLTLEQLEKSKFRFEGKDGDLFTLGYNFTYLVFMNWMNATIILASIALTLFGALSGAWQYILVGVIVFAVCVLGSCSFFYFQWKTHRANDTTEIWKKFSKLLEEFSKETSIPTDIIHDLSEVELREIVNENLRHLSGRVENAELHSSPKDRLRADFKQAHTTFYLLGLAEGAWDKYFAH